MTDNMTDNMTDYITDDMIGNMTDNMTDNMTEDMDEMIEDMIEAMNDTTVVMIGDMTGTITVNLTDDMGSTTESIGNMTLLMAGSMTGNVTGDMTRQIIVIKDIDDIDEMSEIMSNMTGMFEDTGNQPVECNLVGKMAVISNVDYMIGTAEKIDKHLADLTTMDGNKTIVGDITDISDDEGMDEDTYNVTGKVAVIRSIGDTISIVTKSATCDVNQTTTFAEVESMD
jgi:hypothetical protein